MRTIDADALIDDLRHDVAMDQDSLDYEELTDSKREIIQFDKDCKQNAIDLLQNAPTIEPQRWIPCSERLPEKDTCFYLATIANHGLNFITTLPDDVDVVRWDYDRRKGHNSWHWCTDRTVIAWMPLPAPYRKEGD